MTQSTKNNVHHYLRQTGEKGGGLELVMPTPEKGLRQTLKTRKVPATKRKGTGKKVVIVGAGVAGLTLAYELLSKTAYKVIILEANNHIGGRSLTLRPNDSFTEYTNGTKQTCKFNPKGITGIP